MNYVFYGHIYPTFLLLPEDTQIQGSSTVEDQKVDIILYIHGQTATAICTCEKKIHDILTFRNTLLNFTDNYLNSICILYGVMLSIEFLSYTLPEEKSVIPLIPIYKIDEQNLFAEKFENNLSVIVACINGPVGFFVHDCLRNLKLAMTNPIDTGFFTYRCLENIRNSFMQQLNIDESKEKDGWKAMNNYLGGNADEINWIRTKYYTPRRHGRHITITGEDRNKCISIGYKLIYAWICYLDEAHNKNTEAATSINSTDQISQPA
ncbi:hypothetical protein [Desulfovibrio desulfuricans]|uniref:hypothetical protein n=1 Tax=Desulfovibrio desulfuricans TaxID=876 RepID=UPI0003B46755|nr:hypothetical protein [Desulfovibrio desulfuricans]